MNRHVLGYTLITIIFLFGFAYGEVQVSEDAASLYERKCGRCHTAFPPETRSIRSWNVYLNDMAPLAGLSGDEVQLLEKFLREKAGSGSEGQQNGPVLSGYLYSEFFSSKDFTDTFDIHYINLTLSGQLHERISYRAEVEFEHGGGKAEPPFVEQAYIDFRLSSQFSVKVGALLTPFNRFDEYHGPFGNFLVTRPLVSREIAVSAWKEVGIDIHGFVPITGNFYLSYDAYVINGLGSGTRLRKSRQYEDNNDAKSMGFRVAAVLFDNYELGMSYYRGAWDDQGEQLLSLAGFHALLRFGHLDVRAEWSRAHSRNPQPLAAGDGDGFFVQLSYLLKGRLRPVLRYGTLDYLDPGNQLGREPQDFDSRIVAFGLNYMITPSVVIKIEYDRILEGPRLEEQDNDLFAVQAAVRF